MLEHHEILAEFPDHHDTIARLVGENPDFARLVSDYTRLDREVFRLEAAGTPVTDREIEIMKKHRLDLKDRIFRAL